MSRSAALSVAPAAPRSLGLVDLAALGALYVIWGSTYFALRVALVGLPPYLLAGSRFLFAGGLMYAALRVRGAPRPRLHEWGAAARVGFLLLVVANGAVTFAEQWVGSGLAAVMVATMPLCMALITQLSGERASSREWGGLLLGFVGVALLNLQSDLRAHTLGAIALAVSPVAWALGSAWARRLPLPKGAMATATEMLLGGIMMVAVGWLRGERVAAMPPASALWAWGYLVVFGSWVAFSAYNHLLRNVRPSVATSYAYVNPVIALILGVAFGAEHIAAATWVAAAAIIGAVALIV